MLGKCHPHLKKVSFCTLLLIFFHFFFALALPAANNLRTLVPDAGHLLHMPAHIDVLVGHYDDAIVASKRAIEADEKFVRLRTGDNFYTLYRLHASAIGAFSCLLAYCRTITCWCLQPCCR